MVGPTRSVGTVISYRAIAQKGKKVSQKRKEKRRKSMLHYRF